MNNVSFKIYNFVSHGRIILFCSMFLCILLCTSMIIKGFNWGIDFTGGLLIEIESEQDLDIVKIRKYFVQLGYNNTVVQCFNNTKNIIVRLPLAHNFDKSDQNIKIKILDVFSKIITHKFYIQQMNWISPNSSENLIKISIISTLVALICIFLYILVRFELRLSVSVIISLVHDIIIILGILSIFTVEINSTIIAALISVIGYSLNDKIVIFDRFRENFNNMLQLSSFEIINISLSQVLNRTIITSVTTMMVLLVLLVLGGSILYEFSITLLLGVIVGTISSIYITSFLVFKLKIYHRYLI
ncbi:protein-export membrane protein SecF [Candidatus Blochmanniella floridana]|uniref:Protein-export membrane protein SecF n=1 Tax=Blochmanniella floridana TaxID=203907 RepID=Q7VQA8_BLOFL|nr:protein-export membrane protein SecF [Candidatus Blochmannia floridanus]